MKAKVTVLFWGIPWEGAEPTFFSEFVWVDPDDDAEAFRQAKMSAAKRYSQEHNKDYHKVLVNLNRSKFPRGTDGAILDGHVSPSLNPEAHKHMMWRRRLNTR